MKLIKRIRDLIFDSSRKINERVFILLAVMSMFMLFIALVGDFIYNSNLIETLAIIAVMVIVCSATALGVKTDKLDIVIKVTSVIIMLVIPVVFISAGGAEGAAILWFVFYYMFIGLVLTGWWRIINLILLTILVVALFVFEYEFPGLVPKYTRWVFYIDTSLAVIEIGMVCFFMSWFQNRLFIKENEKAKEETRKVEDLNRTQNRFFSNMSHEIRTPINSILGLNEIILRQEDASEEIRRDAGNIEGAGRMLLALINDILDFSKIEAGRMDIVPINYSFSSMISEIVNMIWMRAEEKGLEFNIEVDPSIPSELFGDEVRIKQILINLLNNAVKYTAKGSVTLHVEREDTKEDRALLMFSVIDTGMGIKQDAIPYLFDAFQRIDEEKNSRIEGTGLGLSIVKQLVELMDGRVTVNSVYTQGSTFTVTLWQKITRFDAVGNIDIEGLGRGVNETVYEPCFTAGDVRILIVDDNEMNLEVEKKLLIGTQINVDTATSGEEALLMTLKTRYDMILMDHLMPQMDGIECMQLIRKQTGGLNNHVPVIVLTANAGSENRELYVNSGFDGYLVKPVAGRQLENAILKHVPVSKIVRKKGSDISAHMSTSGSYSRKIPVLVAASSTCDIPLSVLRNMQMEVIPYSIRLDGRVYYDNLEAGPDELSRYMNDGMEFFVEEPTVEEYEAFFGRELKKAHNIIYISVTSPQNTEYERAKKAAKAYGNVNVFDSGLASGGAGIMVLAANRMSMQGKSPEKILEELEILKNRITTCFVTNGTYFKARKTMLDQGIYNIIKLLNIHPFFRLSQGQFSAGKISIGDERKRCYEKFVDFALPRSVNIDPDILIVTYSGLSQNYIELLEKRIRNRCEIKKIVFVKGTAPFVFNSGPGAVGITYIEKGNNQLALSAMLEEDDLPAQEETNEDTNDTEKEEAVIRQPEWYEKIPGINAEHALINAGSEDTLKDMLKIFYESIDEKTAELEGFFKAEDWKNYTIKVHALKSSARLVGADKLADDAQELENAGKRDDSGYIKSHNRDLLNEFKNYGDILKPFFGNNDKKKADSLLIEITYDTIREAAAKKDNEAIREALDDIFTYELPDEDDIRLEQLRDCFEAGDLEAMTALMDTYTG